jgi:hypothetical protein
VYFGRFGFFDSWDISASFKGIAVPRDLVRFVRGVYKVNRLETWPVLLAFSVPLDLHHARLYQVLERRDEILEDSRVGYGFPSPLVFESPAAAAALGDDQTAGINQAKVLFTADVAKTTPSGIRVDGVADGPDHAVLKLADLRVEERTRYLIIRGTVHAGGFQIGVLKDGKWLSQMQVRNHGRFSAVIESNGPGLYTTTIFGIPDRTGADRFTIESVGWSE